MKRRYPKHRHYLMVGAGFLPMAMSFFGFSGLTTLGLSMLIGLPLIVAVELHYSKHRDR